jgi:hypothetical protein
MKTKSHGAEETEHLIEKILLSRAMGQRDFQVMFEEIWADLVAGKVSQKTMKESPYLWCVACEVETKPLHRHVLENIARDFERGADVVLVLVPDGKQRGLRRKLNKLEIKRVAIVEKSRLIRVLERRSNNQTQ